VGTVLTHDIDELKTHTNLRPRTGSRAGASCAAGGKRHEEAQSVMGWRVAAPTSD